MDRIQNCVNDDNNGNNAKRKQNGKINNWNWINIIWVVFAVQPSPTLYNETPCTRLRWMHAYTHTVHNIKHPPPGLPPRIFAWIFSSELLGFSFYFSLFFRFRAMC